jgi:hypothetical protein
MLLFSNPHPHSVHQGMFLSPNTKGRENLFWSVMGDAGWLSIAEGNCNPKQLADICVKAKYRGPFELIFYCYYAFPTDFPEDIRRIFGSEHFSQFIEPESIDEFRKTIQETSVEAAVTFNKGIFNLVSKDQIERYVERLVEGELIQSQIKGIDRYVPIFLTFPTGWRYRRQYRQFRKASLDTIKTAICSGSNVPESKNTTPAAKKQLFARCFLRIEGWPAIQVDSSGQRLRRSRLWRIARSGALMMSSLVRTAAAAEPIRWAA